MDPRKANITYRQLLSHSSGLDPTRAGGSAGDIEGHAIASRTVFAPGTGWQYSNQGIDFLAALAGRLTGKPMDQYLNEKRFYPMGITTVNWVAVSTTFAPNYGLLWWRLVNYTAFGIPSDLLTQWRSMGAPDSTLAKLQSLASEVYPSFNPMYAAIAARLTSAEYSAFTQWLAAGDHVPYYRVRLCRPRLARTVPHGLSRQEARRSANATSASRGLHIANGGERLFVFCVSRLSPGAVAYASAPSVAFGNSRCGDSIT